MKGEKEFFICLWKNLWQGYLMLLAFVMLLFAGTLLGCWWWWMPDFHDSAIVSEYWRVPLQRPYEIRDFHNQGNASLSEWQKNTWILHGIKKYALTTDFVFGLFSPYDNNCSTQYDRNGEIVSEEFTWGDYYSRSGDRKDFVRIFDRGPLPVEDRAKMYFIFSFHDKALEVFDDYTGFTNQCVGIGVDFNSITAVSPQWTNHWEAYKGISDNRR